MRTAPVTVLKKKIMTAQIEENIEIARGIYRMVLHAAEVANSAKAGQFVNLYLNNNALLLPRPLSICEKKGERVVLIYGVVGQGTKELASYENGSEIRISTANGNGFDLQAMKCYFGQMKKRSGKHIILAGGGIGVPPMVELAKRLRAEDNLSEYGLIAVIGFKDEPFLEEELKKYCDEVHVTTDNGAYGFHGNILDCIKELKLAFDYGFACGPKVMLKALAAYCNGQDVEGGIPLQVSMEERMGCGYGACVGCICKISKSESHAASTGEGIVELKKVCKDGPVFFGSEVVFDE